MVFLGRRHEFIAALSAAAALPISAHAQQPLKIWRIGVLESATRELNTPNMNVFLKTLRGYGYDGTTRPNRQLIIDLAETNKIPAIYAAKEFVEDGGLMAYAPNYSELYSRAATFVDRIFKGANPADLPIERPTKLELAINAKTAKTIGIEIPVTLLARADEVIE